jgi:CheY-like chemotaxis protein
VALDRLVAGEEFDTVLCDLMMPDLSGMELYERVAAVRPDVAERFVFITGGAFTPRARAFLDRVPNARIDKPFDAANVRSLVHSRG